MRPVLALTLGDPGGIGPEVALAASRSPRVRALCKPLLVGPRAVLVRAGWRAGEAPLLDPGARAGRSARRPTPEGGRASYAAVLEALALVERGLAAGLVTAPVSKLAWALGGARELDHTQLLERRAGVRAGMFLLGGSLRAILATRHLPLSAVARRLTVPEVARAGLLAARALRSAGFKRPRLGLCALNPHAGEGGRLGSEEARVLVPAIKRLRARGARVRGPLAADAAWRAHAEGACDALIALYHDQAMIPLKLAVGFRVVNWTVGLPFVRTAPGHGTAFDIAGRGAADPGGMIEAALWAARLARP